jgi:hypothetical protein
MKTQIVTTVLNNNQEPMELLISYQDDCIDFINEDTGEILFSCDWSCNLAEVFRAGLSIWGEG